MHIAGHKEGQIHGAELLRGNLLHPLVHLLINIGSVLFALLPQLRQKVLHKPFIISCRSGAALFNQVIPRQAEEGIHQHAAVRHGSFSDVLVDTPGSGNHAEMFLVRDAHSHGTGVNIKGAARYRGACLKARLLCSFLRHMAADIRRIPKRRQLIHTLGKPEELQKLRVVLSCMQINQIAAGIVRALCISLPCQPEAHIVLAGKNPLGFLQGLRLLVLQPGQKGNRLAAQNVLAGKLENLILRSVLFPLDRIAPGPVVRGNNAVADRPVILAPEVQALAVAADGHAGNLLPRHACLLKSPLYHLAVGLPHFIHIPLRKAGFWHQHGRIHSGRCHFPAVLVENRCLRGCTPVVQSKIILHIPSFLRFEKFRSELS